MFGTIRYDRQSQHAEFIDRTESILGDAATEHAACDKCRLTKLRCTGQRSGCDRCRVRGVQCVYSAAGSRNSRRAQKNTGSADLKVKKPSEKTKEKSREKPKRQRRAPGSKKPGNAEPRPAAPADQRRLESVASKDEFEGSRAVKKAGLMSRNEGYHSETIQPKIERGLEQDPSRPVQHGVLGLLATWPQPHQLGLDLAMTTSPYDGLPDMTLDPGFLPTNPVGTSNYTIVGTDVSPDDASPDDDNFAFFTSDSPFTADSESPDSSSADTMLSSETTSPMFTSAPSPPIKADADIDTPYSMENDDPRSCRCFGLVAGIMDDLDDILQPVPSPSVLLTSTMLFNSHSSPIPTTDSMLASLKTQISNATRVIHCTLYQSRTEHVSLLIRACEMIVRLAERVVLCYPTQRSPLHGTNPFRHYTTDSTSTPPPTPAPSPPDILSTVNPANINLENAHSMRSPTEDGSFNATSGMFFGRYKADPSEYETLMRVLIVLQLRALAGLLGSILRQATGMNEHQQQKQQPESYTEDRGGGVKLSERQIARAQAVQVVVGNLIVRLEGAPQGFLTCA